MPFLCLYPIYCLYYRLVIFHISIDFSHNVSHANIQFQILSSLELSGFVKPVIYNQTSTYFQLLVSSYIPVLYFFSKSRQKYLNNKRIFSFSVSKFPLLH